MRFTTSSPCFPRRSSLYMMSCLWYRFAMQKLLQSLNSEKENGYFKDAIFKASSTRKNTRPRTVFFTSFHIRQTANCIDLPYRSTSVSAGTVWVTNKTHSSKRSQKNRSINRRGSLSPHNISPRRCQIRWRIPLSLHDWRSLICHKRKNCKPSCVSHHTKVDCRFAYTDITHSRLSFPLQT